MDIEYVLGRAREWLHNAGIEALHRARAPLHRLTETYRLLSSDEKLSHRDFLWRRFSCEGEIGAGRSDDNGGTVSVEDDLRSTSYVATTPDISPSQLIIAVERNEHLLAPQLAVDKVAAEALRIRRLFRRQDRASFPDAPRSGNAEREPRQWNKALGLSSLIEAEAAEMAKHGICRRPIHSFSVGPFRYTNMRNAVAQAKRELSKYNKIGF